jgi:hypothetical protein
VIVQGPYSAWREEMEWKAFEQSLTTRDFNDGYSCGVEFINSDGDVVEEYIYERWQDRPELERY